MKHKSILIIRLSALGDVGMTIPAIYTLAQRYPQWQITVLTKPFFARMFVNRPSNISFVLFQNEYRSMGGIIRLIRQLHSMHFSCVADFHNLLRSWIIDLSFLFTGTRVCMMRKHRAERKKLLHGTPGQHRTAAHPFVSRYADVLTRLGFDVHPLISSLPLSGENPLPHSAFEKADGSMWVGIAPFARYANKTYPPEKMQEVVRLLSQQENCHVFLFGSKDDVSTLKLWESIASSGITCVAGTMDLEHELALMQQLDVMVSMDSANMHLASLVGTRVVSIWGSTTHHCGFLGWNQRVEDCLWADLPCQPCSIAGCRECKLDTMECMHSITPESIVRKIIQQK